MKAIAMILFLCLSIISCEEKPLDEPAPPPPPPWTPKELSIEVVGDDLTVIPASKNKLIEGSDLNLVIRPLPGRLLESATVNGTAVPVSGTEFSYAISDAKINYLIKVVTKPEPIVIIPTRTDTIVSATRPWHFGSHDYFKNNQWQTYMTLTDGQKTDSHFYRVDGYLWTYDASGNYKGRNSWSWEGKMLVLGDFKYNCAMTDTTLILTDEADGFIFKETYWREPPPKVPANK